MKTSIVVTSISAPNKALRMLADGCKARDQDFILIGDKSSPKDFEMEGCRFYSLASQWKTGLRFAELCPERSYSRKNVGYLLAMRDGAGTIVETDDDNLPLEGFWTPPVRKQWAPLAQCAGWLNVYALFSDRLIWPRGLPLDAIKLPADLVLTAGEVDSPIQQGLANGDPDVDAIFRLIFPDTFSFDPPKRQSVALDAGAWCPFNSQNTTWFKDAFPLMYLPSYCSMRLTDIYRSFVAQRIAWENGWRVTFHAPTVYQERNEHDLMKDFALEVPGYLNNRAIADKLLELPLKTGAGALGENMLICYDELVRHYWINPLEIKLLEAWLGDMGSR